MPVCRSIKNTGYNFSSSYDQHSKNIGSRYFIAAADWHTRVYTSENSWSNPTYSKFCMDNMTKVSTNSNFYIGDLNFRMSNLTNMSTHSYFHVSNLINVSTHSYFCMSNLTNVSTRSYFCMSNLTNVSTHSYFCMSNLTNVSTHS